MTEEERLALLDTPAFGPGSEEPKQEEKQEVVTKPEGEVTKEEGKTVILVEHNMLLMRELCDEIVVMDNGKLLSKGKPEEVLNKKKVLDVYLGK